MYNLLDFLNQIFYINLSHSVFLHGLSKSRDCTLCRLRTIRRLWHGQILLPGKTALYGCSGLTPMFRYKRLWFRQKNEVGSVFSCWQRVQQLCD